MIEFDSYEALVAEVEAGGGIVTCYMASLRDAHGAGKLGVHVVNGISDELARRGLGHYPSELPVQQWSAARVFRLGTPIGNVIKAVLAVDESDSDDILRRLISGDADDKIQRIREIVCD